MKLIDNLTDLLGEDLKEHQEAGSKMIFILYVRL